MQLIAYLTLGLAALASAQSSSTEASDRHSVTASSSSEKSHRTEHAMTDSASSTKTHSSKHSSKSTDSAKASSSSASKGLAAATDVPMLFAGGALGAAAIGYML